MNQPERVDKRLADLEVLVAFQESTISELNQVVLDFVARVERLERDLTRIREDGNAPDVGPQDDPPPHY
jgi:uncharacterized coiled-coil protein SlyX